MAAYERSGPNPTSRTVGVGATTGTDVTVTIGPGHPSTHGALRLALRLDGDVVLAADPQVGFLHRGAEKLFEVRDYRQVAMLANRHDWLSAFGSELGVALAAERLLGLQPPPRAQLLRTVLAELGRAHHHLAFLGSYPLGLAADGALGEAVSAARERLLTMLETATGGRIHQMYAAIGGVRQDVPEDWQAGALAAVTALRPLAVAVRDTVEEDPGVRRATRGVGVLDRATALGHGASGPVLRASDVGMDLRRDAPYAAYDALEVPLVTRTAGDAHARFAVLAEQVLTSLDLVTAALAQLPPGPVTTRLPKVVRVPEGEVVAATENPPGVNGWYLVSRGDRVPYRLKLRTASFAHAALLRDVLPGSRVADLPAVLGSLCIVVGDVDR